MEIEIAALIRAGGGVMHRSSLRAVGVSPYRIRAAIEAGAVVRAGRARVAASGTHPDLVVAAELGARLSCITAARHRGLWVRNDHRLHLSVRPGFRSRGDPPTVLHWGRVPVPVGRDAAMEPVHNTLVHLAACQPRDYAVAAFDSALRTGAVSYEELRQLAGVLRGRFAEVVALADGRADAGGESLARVRLGARGLVMIPQVVLDGHPVDGLIGCRLVIQIDGFEFHKDPSRRARDLAQDRRLALRGYTVFRYPSRAIEERWPAIEDEIAEAVGLGLHERDR